MGRQMFRNSLIVVIPWI